MMHMCQTGGTVTVFYYLLALFPLLRFKVLFNSVHSEWLLLCKKVTAVHRNLVYCDCVQNMSSVSLFSTHTFTGTIFMTVLAFHRFCFTAFPYTNRNEIIIQKPVYKIQMYDV